MRERVSEPERGAGVSYVVIIPQGLSYTRWMIVVAGDSVTLLPLPLNKKLTSRNIIKINIIIVCCCLSAFAFCDLRLTFQIFNRSVVSIMLLRAITNSLRIALTQKNSFIYTIFLMSNISRASVNELNDADNR